ncbi:MAG: hypothetical protein NZM12_13335, partial [Steroidobacteraceae bacterium]|nr:hypothetical protein [Steroidobacteraceae bacterium]MDW8259919.1 hypothetical protein [Gammaproteobacteria bacterium]
SLTAVPANKQATVSVAKALETLTDRDFADILCDRLGLPADLALEIARSGWPRKAVSDLDVQNTDAIAQAIGQAFAWLEEDARK